MLFRAALCAISLVGCALTHERAIGAVDAGPTSPDAFVIEVDAALPTSCTLRWSSLPWCPADPASMLGQHCETEGLACGTQCCEPGPAIACHLGIWTSAPEPDCTGVRCGPNVACSVGACASNQVCLHPSSEIHLPERCVTPPFALDTCDAAPAGWIVDEPRTCEQCRCEDTTHVEIFLECACCD